MEHMQSYIGKPVRIELDDPATGLDSMVVGDLMSCNDDVLVMCDFEQTYRNNSLPTKPSETGEIKVYETCWAKSIDAIDPVERNVFNNAYHPSDNTFGSEWWYFTMFDEGGSVMSGNLSLAGAHKKLMGEVDLAIYNGEGQHKASHVVKRRCRSIEADTEYCNVRVGTDHFYERDGKFHLKIVNKDMALSVEGTPSPGNIVRAFNFSMGDEGSVQWVVPCFRGTYEGELFKEGKTKKVQGTFFHDHNRDDVRRSLKLLKSFKGWMWGLKHKEDESVLYVKMLIDYYPMSFVMRQKNGRCDSRTVNAISVSDDFSEIGFNFKGEVYNNRLDKMHLVPQSPRAVVNKLMNRFVSRKFHAYNSQAKEYLEMKVRSLWNG